MDGNAAAAHVSYAFTEVAAIFPITPSSNMAENVDEWAAYGRKNMFGQEVSVVEMQSEGGAAGAVHGSLAAGALTTTYTASQGLLLMIPNMYKIAGELLPGVFHVSARTLAAHALCIFGDHSDVMSARQTGFAFLASNSVQEAMDLAGVAHLATIKSRVPFVHFFDGFRTSHEIQKIEVIDYDVFEKLVDKEALQRFRDHALSPEHPVTRGTAQNPDIFFQAREAANSFYDAVPGVVEEYMNAISKETGRNYKPFDYVGAPDAEEIIVAMGSVCETIEETINALNAEGRKLGLVKVRLYRPWSNQHFFAVYPKTVKKITVLDRTKEPGAIGDPLFMDVAAMFYDKEQRPQLIAGRYGLGSKDTIPPHIVAIYDNMAKAEPKNHFTVGINDDLYGSSLEITSDLVSEPEGTVRCKFWGLGSDGTVGANKNAIKIIGDNTDLYAQGYFAYDSKKSGGVTISHLRFGKNKIQSTYLINSADFVACHNQAYVYQYNLLKGLKKGGKFVLNTVWNADEVDKNLPGQMKRYIAKNDIKFYTIDATSIAREIGLGNRINMIMQSAFFKLADVIPQEDAMKYNKTAIEKSYGKKGANIVEMNFKALERGADIQQFTVPASWVDAKDDEKVKKDVPAFIEEVVMPMNAQAGDDLPVSAFKGIEDGTFPAGTTQYEKRGVAAFVPEWIKENCIQCNQCSLVCPHATIRPILATGEEAGKVEGFETLKANGKGLEDFGFRIQVSPLDCMGCGQCASICPAKTKALELKPIASQMAEQPKWDYAVNKLPIRDNILSKDKIKPSQFGKPYMEFSGACAGCGETAYIKLVTQLYGDRMMIANATGCSSIWGASAPATPYTKDANGRGPSWANSLFEDNAEFGLGMAKGHRQIRDKIVLSMNELLGMDIDANAKSAVQNWLDNVNNGDESRNASEAVLKALEGVSGDAKAVAAEIVSRKDYLVKKSFWALGGDGWAYDIGFGGLDHVLASGENINVLVFDTEVYSNTGGQASKSTPVGAIAKFAASGMKIKKKDLGRIAMSYGYVYVAQVGMGANQQQVLDAIREAEAYNGPSLIIAYAPCVNHGLKAGMGMAQQNIKEAVECGYWHLYRHNPEKAVGGANPFTLDSKEPDHSKFKDFLRGQVRYSALEKEFSDTAGELFDTAQLHAVERLNEYKKLANN